MTTPTALKSAMTKLREPTLWAPVTTGTPVHVLAPDEAAALLARIKVADKLAEFLVNLRADSTGVAGYHLNGNIAEWDEFEEMNLLDPYRNAAPAGEGE